MTGRTGEWKRLEILTRKIVSVRLKNVPAFGYNVSKELSNDKENTEKPLIIKILVVDLFFALLLLLTKLNLNGL